MVKGSEGGITMKMYKDQDLKEEIKFIHFGKVEAGSSKTVTVWLQHTNKTAILTNLKFKFPSLPKTEKLEVVNAPITIQPKAKAPLTLKWSPSKSFKQALEVEIILEGEIVYIAKRTVKVTE